MDRVVLTVGDVKPACRIGFHAVASRALVTLVDHGGSNGVVVQGAVEQCLDRHTPPLPARQRTVIQSLAIGADGDAVGANFQRAGGTVLASIEELLTFDDHPELWRRLPLGARVIIEPAPALSCGKVDDYHPGSC